MFPARCCECTVSDLHGVREPEKTLHKNLGQSCFPDPTWFPGCRIDTIIAGHTHRPVYENLSLTERMRLKHGKGTDEIEKKFKPDNSYYNTGSCVHPRCITGIEITGSGSDMAITMIKWGYAAQPDAAKVRGNMEYNLSITREILEPTDCSTSSGRGR